MDDHADFAKLLLDFMNRACRQLSDLAVLTGISPNTLKNWTGDLVKRPRFVSDLLKVAQALGLDAMETTRLLQAAGHLPLVQLQRDAQQTGDAALSKLLAPWYRFAAAPDPAPPAVSMQPPSSHYQLRAAIGDFIGRAAEIDQLQDALLQVAEIGNTAAICGIQGMGGIGKTELAYVVAQQVRSAFPDAQIVLALRGASATPLTPEQALQTVIRAFTPAAKLPEDLAALEGLYRALLHGKRVLILADDARDAAQVRPLLPPVDCALLVTSRTRFLLPAMTMVDLDQLPADQASALLCSICPRLMADEAAALAEACGYLPLALRVSGGVLRNTPALAVDDYRTRLADERQRLTQLRDPDDSGLDVAATLTLSYAQLDAATQQVFRQLGVLVADFTTELAQAVIEAPAGTDVVAVLYRLLRQNLIMYDRARGRWRLHDLVRDLARQELEAMSEVGVTQWRYAHAVVAIAQDIQDQYQARGKKELMALSRFDVERAHIDAARRWAQRHFETPAGDRLLLDVALATRYIGNIRYDQRYESIPLWEQARTVARRLGDRDSEGHALHNLGIAHGHLGEISTTIPYFEQRLVVAQELGNHDQEGRALSNLGLAYYSLGELVKAITYYKQALAIAREIGDRRGEGRVHGFLGLAYADLGDRRNASSFLTNLSNTFVDLDNARRAIEACQEAHTIARAIGDRLGEGYALSYLARAQALQGHLAHATDTFAQALTLIQELSDRRGEAECQWLFGLALAQQSEHAQALPLLRAAVAYEKDIGHAKATEHAAVVARLEAGGSLPPELLNPANQRAVGYDKGISP